MSDTRYLRPDGDDYRINFGRRHVGELLSDVAKYHPNWLIEYVLTAYPEITGEVEAALERRYQLEPLEGVAFWKEYDAAIPRRQ